MKRFRSALALLVLFGAVSAGCSDLTTAPQADEVCSPTIGGGGRCAE
jgi:hypothetical protein